MAFEADEEILQDFLVSSQEILETLDKQLVDLEQRPDDTELLNAVFRGFHTIKGGAGFLNLTALVHVCHHAEDVFNLLRKGEKRITPTLMDVVLRAFDAINTMFQQAQAREELTPAEPALMAQLEHLAKPGNDPVPEAKAETVPTATPISGDITDDEFDKLLDNLQGDEPQAPVAKPAKSAPAPTAPVGGDITDSEFDALLDQLNAGDAKPTAPAPTPAASTAKPAAPKATSAKPANNVKSGDITDDEFDKLMDQLNDPVAKPAVATAPPAPKLENSVAKPAEPVKSAAVEKKETKPAVAPTKAETHGQETQETTVRVDTKRLDDIMNMVGELVLVRNRLMTLQAATHDEKIVKAVADLNLVTSDLQSVVMKTRMQPIKKVYGRFPRVVRDLARQLNKEINLELKGEETEVDKNLVEMLYDPLVHLVRNAIDHGVESPDKRAAKGKSRAGTVVLSAEQAGDHILLTIVDDGAGMDPEILRRKAVEKGCLDSDAASRLTNKECFNIIFLPGFSTKNEISDVSGRGVGMDVVRTKINQISGSIDIDSEIGKGTKFSIRVPLTLAIMPTLMVVVGDQVFALPLAAVGEILHLEFLHVHLIDGQQVVKVRGQALPIFYLRHWLLRGQTERDPLPTEGHIVVANAGGQRIGLLVDKLIGQEEVVIKPLGTGLNGTTPGVAGATITGDGGIALILDLPVMIRHYAKKEVHLVPPTPPDGFKEVA